MTKINQLSKPLTRSRDVDVEQPVLETNLDRFRNLIILVPADSDCTAVTRRISSLAKETNSCVQLLGLYKNTSEELALRRELTMASALIRDAKVYVEIVVEKGTNWVEAVRHSYQSGDMIVCIAEQSMGMRHKPLSGILESNFHAPVYVLSKLPPQQDKPKLFPRVAAWSGLIAVLGFFSPCR